MPSKKRFVRADTDKCFEDASSDVKTEPKGDEKMKPSRNVRRKNLHKARKKEVQTAFKCLVEFMATLIPRNQHDGTSGEELDNICRMQFGDYFKGIYAANTHPKDMSEGFFIINTDPFSLPGTHWTAVAGVPPDVVFYDSFDRKSTQLFPEVVLPSTGSNSEVRQRIRESNCGERCVAFLTCVSEFGIHPCKKYL